MIYETGKYEMGPGWIVDILPPDYPLDPALREPHAPDLPFKPEPMEPSTTGTVDIDGSENGFTRLSVNGARPSPDSLGVVKGAVPYVLIAAGAALLWSVLT